MPILTAVPGPLKVLGATTVVILIGVLLALAHGSGAPPPLEPWEDPYYRQRLALFEPLASPARNVLLGDSHVDLGEWAELLPGRSLANRGIGGDTTVGVERRLAGILALRPRCVVLEIGVNDLLGGGGIASAAANHRRIVKTLRAEHVKVVVTSLFPLGATLAPKNAAIASLNAILATDCQDDGIPFIDLRAQVSDAQGNLRADLSVNGVHLNGLGYRIWADALREYLD